MQDLYMTFAHFTFILIKLEEYIRGGVGDISSCISVNVE